MARRADLFLHPKPGTDLVWLRAVTRYLIDLGLEHRAFIDRWVNGFDAYRASLEPFTMDEAPNASAACRAHSSRPWRTPSRAASRVCILWAMGVTQHSQGSGHVDGHLQPAADHRQLHAPRHGRYPLRGHNNVQGASDHGSMPNMMPGYQSVDDPQVRARFEAAWKVRLPTTKGLDNHEMVDAMHEHKLQALYLIGEEMTIVDANANYVREGVRETEVPGRAGHLLQQHLPLRRRGAARRAEPGEGRDVHEHGAPHPAPHAGVRADRRVPARLADHPGCRERARRGLALFASVRGDGGDRGRHAHLRRRELLRGWKAIDRCSGPWPRMAAISRCCIRRAFPSPTARRGCSRWRGPARRSRRTRSSTLHLNNGRLLEHFHEGHHVSHRGHPREDAGYVRRGIAGAGGGARAAERHVGAARLGATARCACARW